MILLHLFPGSWVDRKNEGHFLCDFHEGRADILQNNGTIYVRRPVNGDDPILSSIQPKSATHIKTFDLASQHLKGVDHDIANQMDLVRRYPSLSVDFQKRPS